MSSQKIPISVVDEIGYVWSVEHVRQLREQHRICGLLLGTLPQVAQQNIFLGLPMQLLPEEVVLLVSKSLAYLIDDRSAHVPASEEQSERFIAAQASDAATQRAEILAQAEEKRLKVQSVYADKIEARRKIKAEKKAQAVDAGLLQPEVEVKVKEQPIPAHTIKIAGESQGLEWYVPSEERGTLFNTLEEAKKAGVWNYPATLMQTAKCAVFEDLWSKGNYMGGGLKFGGDLLVYPGDPLRFHSHFSTTVLVSPLAAIQPLDLVAYGRLATGVKKAHLLCSYDERIGKVSYLSLEWAAMG